MNDHRYCAVRQGWCRCDQRCDEKSPPAGRYLRPTMVCERCNTETELYGSHQTCRECLCAVCEACGTDYDAESGRITCHRCATEEQRA